MTGDIETGVEKHLPLSAEEKAQAFAAIDRSKRRHAELLAARGGRLYPPAVHELDEMRAEREHELG